MNRDRILSLLKILITYSDEKHPLSENELKEYLEREDIIVNNRKTIYADIACLKEYGYEVIYDRKNHGYYLNNTPFNEAEIKIIIDAISSIKAFNNTELFNKLLSFIPIYSRNNYAFEAHNNDEYINKIKTVLIAINNHLKLNFIYDNNELTIKPYYLHFSNNKYYLYIKFEDNENTYSYRLDRLSNISVTNESFEDDGTTVDTIKKQIATSFDNYHKNKAQLITLKLINPKVRKIIDDDFPNNFLDNKGNIIIETRPNEVLFGKLASYGHNIKIKAPAEIANAYTEYLKSIIEDY